jgi:hypothetical protein
MNAKGGESKEEGRVKKEGNGVVNMIEVDYISISMKIEY